MNHDLCKFINGFFKKQEKVLWRKFECFTRDFLNRCPRLAHATLSRSLYSVWQKFASKATSPFFYFNCHQTLCTALSLYLLVIHMTTKYRPLPCTEHSTHAYTPKEWVDLLLYNTSPRTLRIHTCHTSLNSRLSEISIF